MWNYHAILHKLLGKTIILKCYSETVFFFSEEGRTALR